MQLRLAALRLPIAMLAACWAVLLTSQLSGQTSRPISFTRDIRPILSENCFQCHGPDANHREADLRFDLEAAAKADLGGYRAISPGKPEASAMLQRITSADEDERMPPADSQKKLTPAEIERLVQWVREGAPYQAHWAYLAPEASSPPEIPRADSLREPASAVDRFVVARLDQQGLMLAPQADPVTLVRRLYFDLIGLPPDPQVVRRFAAEPSDQAYAALVEQLLESQHFGERLAMVWLDLVRYADTVGYHGDQDHSISPYRDWVIHALNENMPFDRFTREQLAGDLLPGATELQRIASGYNRVLQTSHEGGVQEREYLAKYSADRVRNAAVVWLGSTMGCCECHDHKYDPFTQRDFYRFAAFFADIDDQQTFKGGNSLPTRREPEIEVLSPIDRSRLASLERQIDELKASRPDPVRLAALEEEKTSLLANKRRTMITVAVDPRPIRVLSRGDWMDNSGEIVEPGVPAFLRQIETSGRATRLDLARWLTAPDNPLTARVFVNRLWKIYFGRGLATRLDDFGGQGEPPTHPLLLDWLAVEFIKSGWDIKHLVQLMVNSQTYRQSSLAAAAALESDPDNQWFARQTRFRLDAELIRDNALAVSGLLVRRVGGRPARPYQPAGYYQHLNFPKRSYEHDRDQYQYRRGVYTHWQRQFLHPMLKAFDAPTREECTAQRPRSNTPLAALALLNDPTFVEAARTFAIRIINEGGESVDQRIAWAWEQALSRPPNEAEARLLRQLFQQDLAEYRKQGKQAKALLRIGLSKTDSRLDEIETAAWTSVARTIFNLDEFIARQ